MTIIKYKNNKDFFKYLLNLKYSIQKHQNKKDILYIIFDDKRIKCNYILLFVENIKKNNSELIWYDDNIFADQYTRTINKFIKNIILANFNNINFNAVSNNDITNILKFIINYNFENINCEWILTNNLKKNLIEYYIITEIVYY
jgi:hypothetical protein